MPDGFTVLYNQLSSNRKVRGTQFEYIVKFYLENDPYYAHELVSVELWKNSPHAWSTKDLGTDLIAVHREGGLWSIQAKAYDPKYAITKKDVDSWLADSSRPYITYRLLVATTNLMGHNAQLAIEGQTVKVGTRLRSELEQAAITWPQFLTDLRVPNPEPESPRPHQTKAANDVNPAKRKSS